MEAKRPPNKTEKIPKQPIQQEAKAKIPKQNNKRPKPPDCILDYLDSIDTEF